MANRIMGITVEIGGDTTKLQVDIKMRKRSDKKYTAAVEGRGQVIKT